MDDPQPDSGQDRIATLEARLDALEAARATTNQRLLALEYMVAVLHDTVQGPLATAFKDALANFDTIALWGAESPEVHKHVKYLRGQD
jgi:hypothetical protein